MFKIIKLLILLFLIIASFTVPLGSKTFAGHIQAIWKSDETKDMRAGINEKFQEIKKKHESKLKEKMKEELKEELRKETEEKTRKLNSSNSSQFKGAK